MSHDKLTEMVHAALGNPWYLSSESPGADWVLWVDLACGSRVGMSPIEHETLGGTRWYIALEHPEDGPTRIEHVLLTSEAPVRVAARAKALLEVWEVKPAIEVNDGPTKVGMAAGYDYLDPFNFHPGFPIPAAYVVAYGMAHFRGADGYLWFAPDNGRPGEIAWDHPQNIAEFDERNADDADPGRYGPSYQTVMARICTLVDSALAASAEYIAFSAPAADEEQTMFVIR